MSGFPSFEREVRGGIMRTDIFVKAVSKSRTVSDLRRDVDDVFSSFSAAERRFSRFLPESELSVLNASSEVRTSPEMAEILTLALDLYRETEGIFDPSVLPDLEAAGYAGSFGTESFGVPAPAEAAASRFPFSSLTLDPVIRVVRKPRDLRLDLGGIAKGYAADRAAMILRERGSGDFLIDAGGDIYASGNDLGNAQEFFAVDVEGATVAGGNPATLLLRDRAVATSGTGRRRWSAGNEERHHLIDPRTGKSAVTDIASATVVGSSVAQAEVFAKTCVILGRKDALSFADRLRIPVFLIAADGESVYNGLMKPYLFGYD